MEDDCPSRFKNYLKRNLLTILLVTSVVLGILMGIVLRVVHTEPFGERFCLYVGFPGEMLIRLLRCTATPLIISCVVVATGSLDLSVSKTVGWQLIVLIFVTKFLSSIVGLSMALVIQPGKNILLPEGRSIKFREPSTISDIFLDVFRNVFSENWFRMYLEQQDTKLSPPVDKETDDVLDWDIRICYVDGINLLGMIFIAIVVGVCLTVLKEQGRGLLIIVLEVYEVSVLLATWCLWCTPMFLFFLILAEILKIQNFGAFFATWGMFIVTVHIGFMAIFLVMFPLVLLMMAGVSPFKFYGDMSQAFIAALLTASSMAAMPVVMDCLVKHGLNRSLVRFVVPVSININKDGSACYLSIGTMFVAQMEGISLTIGQYVTIIILASMGSMAVAGVPFSGVVVFLMILDAVGLNQSVVGGILAIEWISDRAATFTNTLGNCVIPKILSTWNKKLIESSLM